MNFTEASEVLDVITDMKSAAKKCALNREKINALFNGDNPWTDEEHEANRGFVNVNFLEPTRIAHNARQQLNNGFVKMGNYFRVAYDRGETASQRTFFGAAITQHINKVLKSTCELNDVWEATNAQVVLHGIGPVYWHNRKCPIPYEVGVDEVLVPGGTFVSMRNLPFTAIAHEWTYDELYRMTQGKYVDPGWTTGSVKRILKSLKEQRDLSSQAQGRIDEPEKFEEDLKSGTDGGTGWAPTIGVWEFFAKRYDYEGENEQWDRMVVVDPSRGSAEVERDSTSENKVEFLYDSKKRSEGYAEDYRHFLHWQFGNVSNVAPFRYYSIRSLGYLLYATGRLQNMMRCKFNDRIFSEMMDYFRNVAEADRERFEQIELYHMGVLPEGVSFVTASERHQVNEALVSLGMSQNRQLMAESSATYTPDVERQSASAYQSATEAMIRMQNSQSLNSAMMSQSYSRATYLYQEICRRFAMKGNKHPMVRKFRELCAEDNIPDEVIENIDCWVVEPERVLGGGNKSMEMLQAQQLMNIRPQLDPDAQRDCTRKFITATTDDPKLAVEWVAPQPKLSSSAMIANLAFGTLMGGFPFEPEAGISEPEYINTLLQLMNIGVQQLDGLAQMPNSTQLKAQKIGGLINASQHVEQHINIMGQDPQAIPQAKMFGEGLSNIISRAKPHRDQMQKEMEEQQQQGVIPPSEIAKIEATKLKAQTDSEINVMKAQQKERHRDVSFMNENERRNATTAQDIQRDQIKTLADVKAKDLETAAKIHIENKQAMMAPRPQPAPKSSSTSKK